MAAKRLRPPRWRRRAHRGPMCSPILDRGSRRNLKRCEDIGHAAPSLRAMMRHKWYWKLKENA